MQAKNATNILKINSRKSYIKRSLILLIPRHFTSFSIRIGWRLHSRPVSSNSTTLGKRLKMFRSKKDMKLIRLEGIFTFKKMKKSSI